MVVNKCSLLISTYNWPKALNLCLKSVVEQTVTPNEIIIADDGSDSSTALLVQEWAKNTHIPIKHIWQEDNGFQLAKIRNKGIAACESDYIIQIDGDLVLHKEFINDHLYIKKRGAFVTRSRVFLSEKSSQSIIHNQSIEIKKYSKNSKNSFNELRNRALCRFFSSRYKINGKNKYYVKGCNMAYWKENVVGINGYNESFSSWGWEDSELAIRLMNNGTKKQFLKMGGICYHLFHKETPLTHDLNFRMMKSSIQENKKWANDGIDKYTTQYLTEHKIS